MSVEIDYNICSGCVGQKEPYCIKYCPGDLLAIDKDSNKPYIRSKKDCWDCMVCVKACPLEAIETKLAYQLANYKASLKPKVYKEKIIWKLCNLEGKEEIFELKTGSTVKKEA